MIKEIVQIVFTPENLEIIFQGVVFLTIWGSLFYFGKRILDYVLH